MFAKVFLTHPRSVNESYLEHLRFAFAFSWALMVAAGAAFLHGIVPCLFEKTASRSVRRLADMCSARGR
jgi:hypothetical protein